MLCGNGASELGFQLAMYRWLDGMEEARRIRETSIESHNMDVMVARYNDLVERFNTLVTAANQLTDYARSLERGTQDRDARIAELERQLCDERAERQRLHTRVIELGDQVLERMWADEAREAATRSQET